jgi:hypothetical protein
MSKRYFLLLNLLLLVLSVAPCAFAQTPLTYFKNYFVSGGDYVVGGWLRNGSAYTGVAYGTGSSYANGTISIPDTYQASQGGIAATSLPAGVEIVAAFLYWQTVESSQTGPAGQTVYFSASAPDANGNPVNPYTITGTNPQNASPVSWSSGGCSGSSGGTKIISTYRADVLRFLNIDSNGLPVGNGTYTVSMADSGSNGNTPPVALGATLVLVIRDPASTTLNGVVLYEGTYSPSNPSRTTTQLIQGFYQPSTATTPNAKFTAIASSGQHNKYETVSLQTSTTDGAVHPIVTLPSLYGNGTLPPFPGLYNGSWDNPTWLANSYGTAVLGEQNYVSSVTATITPRANNNGCVSAAAMILKTDVQDTDGDGLLDVWETNSGLVGPDGNPLPDIHAMGANPNVRDIFVDIDYMYTPGYATANGIVPAHSHLPSQAVLDKVGNAFKKQGINVHFDVGNNYQNGDPYVIQATQASLEGGNQILETACNPNNSYCLFPNFAGTVGWKLGFLRIKNGDPSASPPLPAYFDHSRKDIFHYAVFAHTMGLPRWMMIDGTLISVVVSGGTATVTTAVPHLANPGDFVSISGAPGSANLNGVYSVATVIPANPPATASTSFTISIPLANDGTYQNRGLGVGNGIPRSTSGVGDIFGGDVMITLGLWDNFVGSNFVQASTLMHELGHNLGLGHAGDVNDSNNCKTNYQSIMSYMYQIPGLIDQNGITQIDYSGIALPPLAEDDVSEIVGLNYIGLPYLPRWYAPASSTLVHNLGISPAGKHCDGTPITANDYNPEMARVDGDNTTLTTGQIDWNYDGTIESGTFTQDLNFNGSITPSTVNPPTSPFQGFNDWIHIKPNQIGNRWNAEVFSLDVRLTGCPTAQCDDIGDYGLTSTSIWTAVSNDWSDPSVVAATFGGGGLTGWGGGGGLTGWGGGGLTGWGGGGGLTGWGGGGLTGWGGEQDVDTAAANGNAPSGLTATPTKFTINLSWSAPNLGTANNYTVWRGTCTVTPCTISNSSPSPYASVSGTTTTFVDSNTKNGVVYLYFVEANITYPNHTTSQSGPSNIVTASR